MDTTRSSSAAGGNDVEHSSRLLRVWANNFVSVCVCVWTKQNVFFLVIIAQRNGTFGDKPEPVKGPEIMVDWAANCDWAIITIE